MDACMDACERAPSIKDEHETNKFCESFPSFASCGICFFIIFYISIGIKRKSHHSKNKPPPQTK